MRRDNSHYLVAAAQRRRADTLERARQALGRASNLPDCGPNRVRFGKESRSWHEDTRNTSPSFVTR